MDVEVQRPQQVDSTAIGAALLAGIGSGLWSAQALPSSLAKLERSFVPAMSAKQRQQLFNGWRHAVAQVQANN